MPLDLRRPSTPTMGMIANSAFTSRGRSSRGEPPAAAAAGAHLFSGLATASSGEAMSGAAREGRTAERLIGLAGAKPSAAPTASNMVGPGRIRQRAAVPRGANPANVHAATCFPPCGISLITPGNQHTPRLVSFGQGHPNVHWSMPPSLTLHDSLFCYCFGGYKVVRFVVPPNGTRYPGVREQVQGHLVGPVLAALRAWLGPARC
jgi:hypothetical protein